MVRVALCDDHSVVRAGLRKILEAEDDFEVVGDVATVAEAVTMAGAQVPDVFVVDLGLGGEGGLDAIPEILRASPATRILVFTMHDDVGYVREAFAAGAHGYLLKDGADSEFIFALRLVAAGRQYVYPTLVAEIVGPAAEKDLEQITPRERDILRHIARGYTNAEIATRLFLSIRTVETHRSRLNQKLGARTRAELVRFAREAGLA